LLPEQAFFTVENAGFEFSASVRVTQLALAGKQGGEFLAQKFAGKRLAVTAAFVSLVFGEFGQHHFGGGAVVLFAHQGFGALQPLLDLATLGGFSFGLACKPETAMFAQVVNHPRPFFSR